MTRSPPVQVEMVHVNFDFADDLSRSYITGASIMNDPVANYAEGFDIEKGMSVELTVNTSVVVDEFTANGQPIENIIAGIVLIPITENTTIRVRAHVYNDVSFTLTVDHASRIEAGYKVVTGVGYWATETFVPLEIVDGVNNLTLNEKLSTVLYIHSLGEGNVLTGVTVDGTPLEYEEEAVVTLTEGCSINVTTDTTIRDAVATVKADNPALVSLTIGNTPVTLTEAEQQVEFFSTKESTFTIKALEYPNKVWGVKHNGTEVQGTEGTYVVENVANGDVIEITTKAPQVQVAFTFANWMSEEAFSTVTVFTDAGNPVKNTDYVYEPMVVDVESYIELIPNEGIVINELTVTGAELESYPGSYGFKVYNDVQVYVDAAYPVTVLKVLLEVDDATHIVAVTKDAEGAATTLQLEHGLNVLEYEEAPTHINIAPAPGYTITSMQLDGVETEHSTDIRIYDAMSLIVTTAVEESGITAIESGAEARYYNLQGVAVAAPQRGDIVIERRGAEVRKVVVR